MTEVEPFLQRAIDVLVSEKLNNEQRSIWLDPIFTYFVYQSACYVFNFPLLPVAILVWVNRSENVKFEIYDVNSFDLLKLINNS